jgi:hypothetical protein
MMVNNSDYEYSQEIFQEILMNVDISSCAWWEVLPEIFIIIIQWKNTPLSTFEYIFELLRDYRPEHIRISRWDKVEQIWQMMLHTRNKNMTPALRARIQRELKNIESLMKQWRELESRKVVTSYSSGSSERKWPRYKA